MKNSSKALIWSAFVFPGAGQIFLKKRKKGYIFVALALCCTFALFIILVKFTYSGMESRALSGETINLSTFFSSILASLVVAEKTILPPLFLIWLFSLIDAWKIGNIHDKNNR